MGKALPWANAALMTHKRALEANCLCALGVRQATQEKVAALMQAAEAKDGRRAAARSAKSGAAATSPAGSSWRVRPLGRHLKSAFQIFQGSRQATKSSASERTEIEVEELSKGEERLRLLSSKESMRTVRCFFWKECGSCRPAAHACAVGAFHQGCSGGFLCRVKREGTAGRLD